MEGNVLFINGHTYHAGGHISWAVEVSRGVVITVQAFQDQAPNIQLIDYEGKMLWKTLPPERRTSWSQDFYSRSVMEGDQLVGQTDLNFGDVLDLKTGRVLEKFGFAWVNSRVFNAGGFVKRKYLFAGGTILFVHSPNGGVALALNERAEILWSNANTSRGFVDLLVVDGVLKGLNSIGETENLEFNVGNYVVSGNVLNIKGGKAYRANAPIKQVLEFSDGFVILLDANHVDQENILLIDRVGKPIWKCPRLESKSKVFQSDSYVHINRAEGQLIATTFEGVTNQLDLQTGKVIK